jgi:DNA-binding NarL/FixJ family response regulator
MGAIRVLLVDDHAIVRQGLRLLVETAPDIAVVGEASDGRQAVHLAVELQPDVVVTDLAMPLLNGIEATRQILRQNPKTKVLALSAYNDQEYGKQLTQAGASGYLHKHKPAGDLINAIREVHRGNVCYDSSVRREAAEHLGEGCRGGARAEKRKDSLTVREAEVLQLIAEGQPNKQIASELCISFKTVEKHRQQLMYKLNIHDVAGLTRYAISRGIVETGTLMNKSVSWANP